MADIDYSVLVPKNESDAEDNASNEDKNGKKKHMKRKRPIYWNERETDLLYNLFIPRYSEFIMKVVSGIPRLQGKTPRQRLVAELVVALNDSGVCARPKTECQVDDKLRNDVRKIREKLLNEIRFKNGDTTVKLTPELPESLRELESVMRAELLTTGCICGVEVKNVDLGFEHLSNDMMDFPNGSTEDEGQNHQNGLSTMMSLQNLWKDMDLAAEASTSTPMRRKRSGSILENGYDTPKQTKLLDLVDGLNNDDQLPALPQWNPLLVEMQLEVAKRNLELLQKKEGNEKKRAELLEMEERFLREKMQLVRSKRRYYEALSNGNEMRRYKLEICIDSLESARAALNAGATQLEVCSALSLGGLTPSIGLVKRIRCEFPQATLMVMIRSRGGDFVNEEHELLTLEEDLKELKKFASGFVFGFLNESNQLDEASCSRLLNLAKPLPCTLHRAFDHTKDWKQTTDQAMRLGFRSILTSGQKPRATDGMDTLAKLYEYAEGRIDIIVGSGVTHANLEALIATTKCSSYHGSGSVSVKSKALAPPFPMGPSETNEKRVTDQQTVAKMVNILEKHFEQNGDQ